MFERPFQVVSLRGAVNLDKHEKVSRRVLAGHAFGSTRTLFGGTSFLLQSLPCCAVTSASECI